MQIVYNYFTVSSLLIFITSTLFGVVVVSKNPKKLINIAFGLFALSVSGWSLFYYVWQISSTEDQALLYTRILMAFAIFIPVNYFFIVLTLLDKLRQKLWLLITAYAASFIFLGLVLTPLMVKSIEHTKYHDFWPIAGSAFGVFLLIWFLIVLYPSFLLYRAYKESKNIDRKRQILLILVGISIAVLGGSTNYFQWYHVSIPPLGNIIGPIWVVLISYAIIKHNLLNIKLIITEIALYLINGILLIEILSAKNLSEFVFRILLLIMAIYVSYLAIKSIRHEIKQKEQLQVLTNQLSQANEHLKELDAMKTEFVSLASHELLTPVSAIEGYLSMLLDEKLAKVEDPKAVHYLDRVYGASKRLARLVSDMLNVSRIEEGRLLVEKKDVDLTVLVKQVADELKFKAEEGKQKIEFANPDGWSTFGDADKIKEVMVNLIGNSIKYSKDPGTITISIEKVPTVKVEEAWSEVEKSIKTRPLDDQEAIKSAVDEKLKRLVGKEQILVKVKDEGIGIPKEELPKLFKKFHRVGDYTTAESQGTGLGLYISRALVELHHGRIWADSEGSHHGSTFIFSLPELENKKEIEELEAQVPKKGDMKPLARPAKQAEEI